MPLRRRVVALLGAVCLLAACGSASDRGAGGDRPGAGPGAAAGPIPVVASTNVWGDIAAHVGGSRVRVTSLVHNLAQDPHDFQPSGRDELAVSRAKVVIVNGGGYDDFMGQMLAALGNRPIVVTAFDVAAGAAGFDPHNEHLWLNLDAVAAVASAIGRALGDVDPAERSGFEAAATDFTRSLAPVRAEIDRIARVDAHAPIAVTEPLPLYLTTAAGLDNLMPASFIDATEEGIDVAPSEMAEVLALLTERRVRLVIYNEQSASTQTSQLLDVAARQGIPVLSMTEILPPGESYQHWIGDIVHSMGAMLGGGAATRTAGS